MWKRTLRVMMFAARIVHWIVSRCVQNTAGVEGYQTMGIVTLIVARRSVNLMEGIAK